MYKNIDFYPNAQPIWPTLLPLLTYSMPIYMHLPPFESLAQEALTTLERLIAIPSPSREEGQAADFLQSYLLQRGARPKRIGNNLLCLSDVHRDEKPSILLNAHIDTVRPTAGWTLPPFQPTWQGDRLYGLGSNDCGGGLVCLMEVFLFLRGKEQLPYNLVFLASAEEEVSGKNGFELARGFLPPIETAIVGEPTGMHPAVAEKGLMVLDCTAVGKAGHAARNEGINAIYLALEDIQWFRTFHFPRVSPLLGEVKMSVTMLTSGTQHNVVPDKCSFTVDIRANELYTNSELLALIKQHVRCTVKERSTRLNSSHIDPEHPLIQAARNLGKVPFGSPTLSDQALMPFPSFKMGPGLSERSHTADEFISKKEILGAIKDYLFLLDPQLRSPEESLLPA